MSESLEKQGKDGSGDPEAMSVLFGLEGDASAGGWGEDELRSVYEHQMRTPVKSDLSAAAQASGLDVVTLVPGENPGMTFGELLGMRSPDVKLLRLVKDFAKRAAASEELPERVATAVYFIAIAAAAERGGESITSSGPDVQRRGIATVLHEPWLDGKAEALLTRYCERLS